MFNQDYETKSILAGLQVLDHVSESGDIAHMDNQTARAIKEARYEYRKEILQAPDKVSAFWDAFELVYSRALKQDTWSGQIYCGDLLSGRNYEPKSPDDLLNDLEVAIGVLSKMPTELYRRKLTYLMRYSQFNPVQEYLKGLPRLTPEDWQDFGSLAKTLFGTEDNLSQTKLTRWLIGAVARVMEPGCKMDSALVIRGKQGIGKTSMLAALFGDHFRTLHSHQGTTEQQRVMQQAWGCELGELEATFRTKDIAALKAFLTETHDSYRDLYVNAPIARPRHTVFAGTTNEAQFLNDSTGSRRFWVIDANAHQIPVEYVKANRDNIWAVALHLYNSGEPWWMSQDEAELSEATNKEHQQTNPYIEPIEVVLGRLEKSHGAIQVRASDIMTTVLQIKPENHRRCTKETVAALESLGYVKTRLRVEGSRTYVYGRPDAPEATLTTAIELDAARFGR